MSKRIEFKCKNVFKNDDVERRKRELAKMVATIINSQLKTKNISNRLYKSAVKLYNKANSWFVLSVKGGANEGRNLLQTIRRG